MKNLAYALLFLSFVQVSLGQVQAIQKNQFTTNTTGTVLGNITVAGGFVGDGASITNLGTNSMSAEANNRYKFTIAPGFNVTTSTNSEGVVTVNSSASGSVGSTFTNAFAWPFLETASGFTVSSATQAAFDGAYNSNSVWKGETAWTNTGGKYLAFSSAKGRWYLSSTLVNIPNQSDFNVSSVNIEDTYTGPDGSAVVAATVGIAATPSITSYGNIDTTSFEADTAELAGMQFGTVTNLPTLEVGVTDSNAVWSMTADGQNRITVAKPGNWLGLQAHRSVMIGANQDTLAPQDAVDIRNITNGANTNWIDFSTSGTGADLWVEDNVQAGGNIYTSNDIVAGTFTGDGSGLTNVVSGNGFPLTATADAGGQAITNIGSMTMGSAKSTFEYDVVNLTTATDNNLVRFNGGTGRNVQDSSGSIDDAGLLSVTSINVGALESTAEVTLSGLRSGAYDPGTYNFLFTDSSGLVWDHPIISFDSTANRIIIYDNASLSGTNITTGTINSNKLDAATLALLGSGGGGGAPSSGGVVTIDFGEDGAESLITIDFGEDI